MGVFLIELWSVKEGKEKEHEEICMQILRYIKEHRENFAELRSERYFKQWIGGEGKCITVQEYESLADMEEMDRKIGGDEAYLKLIRRWKGLIEKGSKSELWFDRLRECWIEE